MPVTYWAELDGGDSSLTLLATCFTEPECQVLCIEDGDITGWILRSSMLVYAPTPVRRTVVTDAGETEIVVDEPHSMGSAMDHVNAWTAARLQAMNGAARLLDPHYQPVRIHSLQCKRAGSGIRVSCDVGMTVWVLSPSPSPSLPPTPPETLDLVRRSAALALEDETVATVMAVLAMPPTWTALGLVINAISDDVGGQEELEQWIPKPLLRRLTGSINFARDLKEGSRHLGKVAGTWNAEAALDLQQARRTVDELVNHWIGSKLGRVAHRTYR